MGQVPNSGYVIAIGECVDGTLVGVGTDNLLYKAPRLSVGAATSGYTQVTYDNNWYKLQPTSYYWMMDTSELNLFLPYYRATLTSFAITTLASRVNTWIETHKWDNWKSGDDFKSAYVAYVTATAKSLYSDVGPVAGPASPQPPAYATSNGPLIRFQAASLFSAPPAPGFAAWTSLTDTQLDDSMLRMFLATPYYCGPGVYELLCANRRVVRVALDRDELGGKSYKIVSRSSGMVLASQNGSTADGAAVVQAVDDGSPGQQWSVVLAAKSGYCILSRGSGNRNAIQVPSSSTASGTLLVQGNHSGGVNQQWNLVPVTGGYYKIVSAVSGKLVDVPGNSVVAGTQVCQWDDSGNTNQQWSLVWIP